MPTVDPPRDTTPHEAERAAAELLDRLPPDLAAGRHRLQQDATTAARAAADTLDGLATFLVAHQALCAATSALASLIAHRTGHDRGDVFSALRDDHRDSDAVVYAIENTYVEALVHAHDVAPAAAELHALAARLRHDTPPDPPPPAVAATVEHHQDPDPDPHQARMAELQQDRQVARDTLDRYLTAAPASRPDALEAFQLLPAGDRYVALYYALLAAEPPHLKGAVQLLDETVGERLAAERDAALASPAATRPAGTPPAGPHIVDEIRCRRLVILDDTGTERIVAEVNRGGAAVTVATEGHGTVYNRPHATLYAEDGYESRTAGVAALAGRGGLETVADLWAVDEPHKPPRGSLTLYANDGRRCRDVTIDGDQVNGKAA